MSSKGSPKTSKSTSVRDAVDMLAAFVASFVYENFEEFFEAGRDGLCGVLGEGGSAEEVFEYLLIGVARGVASYDDPEMAKLLARLETERGVAAERAVEIVASRAHELIRERTPKFYRSALEYIRRRCRALKKA